VRVRNIEGLLSLFHRNTPLAEFRQTDRQTDRQQGRQADTYFDKAILSEYCYQKETFHLEEKKGENYLVISLRSRRKQGGGRGARTREKNGG